MRYIRNFRLEQFCLSVIQHNLKRIIRNRNIPQKQVHFLLHLYGDKVFEKYYSSYPVSEDAMLWFLTPYMKEIKIVYYSERVLKQLQVVGTRITSLSLSASLVTESILNSIICCVPNVKSVDFSFSNCSDKTLLLLQRMCPHVTSLNLQGCKDISDHGLRNLYGINLKHLSLADANVTQDGMFQVLQIFPSLQSVEDCYFADIMYRLNKASLENNIFTCYNLTEFMYNHIGRGPVKNVILAWTILCPYVKKVHIDFPVLEEMVLTISKFEYLEDLKLNFDAAYSPIVFYNKDYTGGSMEAFRSSGKVIEDILLPFSNRVHMLTTLDLTDTNLSMKTLVKCYTKMKWLRLHKVTFSKFKEEEVEFQINDLSTLIISDVSQVCTHTYKAFLWLLSASQKVEHLHLNYFKELPEEMLSIVITSYKKLSLIDLSFTPISIEPLLKFFEIPTLEKIIVDCCYKIPNDINSDLRSYVTENVGNSLSWRLWENEDVSDNW